MRRVEKIDTHEGLWVHENVLDESTIKSLEAYCDFLAKDPLEINKEKRRIVFDDHEYPLLKFNTERSYKKLWHLSYTPGYWEQTNESIVGWWKKALFPQVHPAVRVLLTRLLQLEPLNDGNWIPFRGIFNRLVAGVTLDPHTDGERYEYDNDKYSCHTATTYFKMAEQGGEFWDEFGFFHKPKVNSTLINHSRNIIHGVLPGSTERLGISIRFIKAEDLILPGNVDELLYKP